MPLAEIAQDQEGQQRQGQERWLIGQQQCSRDRDVDGADDNEEPGLDAATERLAPRSGPDSGEDGDDGGGVGDEVGGGAGQCRPHLDVARSGAAGPSRSTNTRAATPVDVTTRPTLKAVLRTARRLTTWATTATSANTSTVTGGRHEQDQKDEDPLVDVEHIGFVVHEEGDGPDPAGRHERAEDDGEHRRRCPGPAVDPDPLARQPQRPRDPSATQAATTSHPALGERRSRARPSRRHPPAILPAGHGTDTARPRMIPLAPTRPLLILAPTQRNASPSAAPRLPVASAAGGPKLTSAALPPAGRGPRSQSVVTS